VQIRSWYYLKYNLHNNVGNSLDTVHIEDR
jgi:hypothetical protein